MRTFITSTRTLILIGLIASLLLSSRTASSEAAVSTPDDGLPFARNIIVMIADGWGYAQLEAAELYSGKIPGYRSWLHYAMSTYPFGGSYDPTLAWADFAYVRSGTTDSAAAATAMFTGQKTLNGRIGVGDSGVDRFFSIVEKARAERKWGGAVTSVYLSHATPGAWYAHNVSRSNGFAIADEGLWGDPNTTGTPLDDARYDGGLGPTEPPLTVLIGAGHPLWNGGSYVNTPIRDKLFAEDGAPDAFRFVERISGSPDGGSRLLAAAANPETTRLAGLFGGAGGNLEWQRADGSGANAENPTLAEMTQAALTVLNRSPGGFVLLIEGGAVDWAGHANNMDHMVGELLAFNDAFEVVNDWVTNPTNGSSWENTLVLITGDHETGYLSAGPDIFPDHPLGDISGYTLGLEKEQLPSGRRASWEDTNNNEVIDQDETVYWAWNNSSHTNSLIPIFAQGPGTSLTAAQVISSDPIRGPYLDNTSVHTIMDAVLLTIKTELFLPIVVRDR